MLLLKRGIANFWQLRATADDSAWLDNYMASACKAESRTDALALPGSKCSSNGIQGYTLNFKLLIVIHGRHSCRNSTSHDECAMRGLLVLYESSCCNTKLKGN